MHTESSLSQAKSAPIEPFWSQVTSVLDSSKRNVWYWGHVHAGYVHAKVGPVEARCVGHGAVPWGPSTDLAVNPKIEWYEQGTAEAPPRMKNGFGVLRFDGPTLREEIRHSTGALRWSRPV